MRRGILWNYHFPALKDRAKLMPTLRVEEPSPLSVPRVAAESVKHLYQKGRVVEGVIGSGEIWEQRA
jgi:hypothetical protein